MIDTYVGYHEVPYYSQKRKFLLKEGSLKLSQIDEWENNLCGLVCALMVLNAFSTGSEHTIAEVLSLASKIDAFDQRRGWIHKKIVSLLGKYGIKGKCRSADDLDVMRELLNRKNLIIASVAPNYLNAESTDTTNKRGGHLVLIVGMYLIEAGNYQLFINDPGNEVSDGGQNLTVDSSIFESHFSGNIIVFENPKS